MHRGLTEASEHASPQTRSPPSPSSPAQHGLHRPRPDVSSDDDICRPGPVHDTPSRRGKPDRVGSAGASSGGNAVVDVQTLDEKLRRLSGGGGSGSGIGGGSRKSPSSVAGQRIAEYERALTPAALRRDRVVFQVVKRAAGASATGRSLNDFPNEVLTHVFSYLQPGAHASVALVSKRFYSLITTPHAWRMAFLRFFPGREAAALSGTVLAPDDDLARSEARLFAPLTPLASWRSEYLLRTRLLRSLMSGKPGASIGVKGEGPGSKAVTNGRKATAVITYNSQLLGVVDQLQAVFASTGKKSPRVIHGAAAFGVVTSSNPSLGKLEGWGYREEYLAPQLEDVDRTLTPYGLGPGRAAVPNVMDVSHVYGAIVGEGFPGGRPLTRSIGDRSLAHLESVPRNRFMVPDPDMPVIPEAAEAVCAVWIAKSTAVPTVTKAMIGTLVGTSLGVVSAYSLDKADSASRYPFTQATARWVLCPGVPIIALRADDSYTEKRRAARRVWAVALNALGEVYYLQDVPAVPAPTTASAAFVAPGQRSGAVRETLAWQAGRTAAWELVEPSRRAVAADCRFDDKAEPLRMAASPSPPRLSPGARGLDPAQRAAEARAVERYFDLLPSHFRAVYDTWDMRRKLEVDFAGGSSHADGVRGTGEHVVVVGSGADQRGQRKAQPARVTRYTRLVTVAAAAAAASSSSQCATPAPFDADPSTPSSLDSPSSLLGAREPESTPVLSVFSSSGQNTPTPPTPPTPTPTPSSRAGDRTPRINMPTVTAGWQATNFSLKGSSSSSSGGGGASPSSSKKAEGPATEITCCAIDLSLYSTVAPFEDPLLQQRSDDSTRSGSSAAGGAIPGRRARWLVVGTKAGSVVVWNMREPAAEGGVVWPLRVIRTDSPAVTSVAASALYLVHGGSDGLVQAWDPLASTADPVRTLNAPSAGRVPRHLAHLRAQLAGAADQFAAVGAIALDPDPAVLRGVLAVGTLLRFWSYSSAIHGASRKKGRRLRHTNADGQLVSGSSSSRRGGAGQGGEKVAAYIAAEAAELRREQERDERHRARLLRRFGVGLAGLTEEEAVRYAEIMSQEAFFLDEQRRSSGSSGESSSTSTFSGEASVSGVSVDTVETVTPEPSMSGRSPPGGGSGFARSPPAAGSNIRRVSHGGSSATGASTGAGSRNTSTPAAAEDDDFELQIQRAIRLSLMEGVNDDDNDKHTPVPAKQEERSNSSSNIKGKGQGKGKGKASSSSPFASASASMPSSPETSYARSATPHWEKETAAAAAGPSSSSLSAPADVLLAHHAVGDNEEDDFQLALRLSLQESEAGRGAEGAAGGVLDEQAQYDNDAALAALLQDDEFPALEVKDVAGKGKGKGKGV